MTHAQLDLWVQDNWEKKVDSLFGLEADRPATAARPTIYFATDTDLPYFWADGPSWTEMGSGGASANDYKKYSSWVDGTDYKVGDSVIDSNEIYRCTTAGVQATDFDTNKDAWIELDIINYIQHDLWKDGTDYKAGDEILEDNKLYICNTDGIQNTDFTTNVLLWDLKVEDNYKIYDSWNDTKVYVIGDEILEGNNFYVCNTDGVQSTDFTTNVLLWDLKVEDNYKIHPVWEAKTYAIGDRILHNNTMYECGVDGAQATDFATNNTSWIDIDNDSKTFHQPALDLTLTPSMNGKEIHLVFGGKVTADLELLGKEFNCTIIDVANASWVVEMVYGGSITAGQLYMRDGRDTPSVGTASGTSVTFLKNESIDLRINSNAGQTEKYINIKKFAGQQVAVAPTGILQMTAISNNDAVAVPNKNMQLTMKSAPANAYVDSISALEDDDVSITVVYALDLAGGTTPKITNPDDANEITVASSMVVNGQEVTAQYSLVSLATRPAFITLVHGEKEEQIDITWVTKPTIVSAFTGAYPTTNTITQTELKKGDNRELAITPSTTMAKVETQTLNGYTGDVWYGSHWTTLSPNVDYALDAVVSRAISVRFQDDLGTYSHWTLSTNTSELSDYCPSHLPDITYPAGQEAIKDAEPVTIVPATAVGAWITTTLETLEANELIYVTDKTGTQLTRHASSTYNEHADYGIRYFNTRNGKIVTIPGTVFIAHTDAELDMTGTDNDPFQVISKELAGNYNMPYKVNQLLMGETSSYSHNQVMVSPVHGAETYADYVTAPKTENISVTNKAGKVASLPRAYFFQGFEQIVLEHVYAYSVDKFIEFDITNTIGDPVVINISKVSISGSFDSDPVTNVLSGAHAANDLGLTSAYAWTIVGAGTKIRMSKQKLGALGWGDTGHNLTINIEETV